MHDPFRHSLSQAIQWFDVLQVELEHWLDTALTECRQ